MRLIGVLLLSVIMAPVAGIPTWTWDTVQRFAHCANESGLLRPDVAKYFATLPFVTIEKYQGLKVPPVNQNAETKIMAVGAQIKAINPSTEVLLYYQADWARTWYASGMWFDAHPNLEVHDKNGALIKGSNNWHLYDYAQEDARTKYVQEITHYLKYTSLDGVFIDGFRPDEQYKVIATATAEEQKAWLAGLNSTMHQLRSSIGSQTTFISNGMPYADPSASGLMVEAWSPKKHGVGLALRQINHPGKIVQVHCNSCDNSDDFDIALATFLIGVSEGTYLGWGSWTDCGTYLKNDEHDEFHYPLGKPKGIANHTGDTYTRSFASGTTVLLNASFNSLSPPLSCIRWGNGKTTGNAC